MRSASTKRRHVPTVDVESYRPQLSQVFAPTAGGEGRNRIERRHRTGRRHRTKRIVSSIIIAPNASGEPLPAIARLASTSDRSPLLATARLYLRSLASTCHRSPLPVIAVIARLYQRLLASTCDHSLLPAIARLYLRSLASSCDCSPLAVIARL